MKIIRVVPRVSPTSSPVNQFTIGRSRDRPDEKTVIVSFFGVESNVLKKIKSTGTSNQISVACAEGNPFRLISLVRKFSKKFSFQKTSALVHLHTPILAAPLLLLRPFLLFDLPVVFTVHNNFQKYTNRNKILSVIAFILADKSVFVSRDSAQKYPKVFKSLGEPNWQVVQNGVDVQRVDHVLDELNTMDQALRSTLCVPLASLDLVAVGRLIPQKNHKFLIDVLAELDSDSHLTIIGEGSLKKELTDRAKQKGVAGQLHFTGLLPREEVYIRLAEADIFLSAARWEGLPVAVMEAMAVGLPTVLSDIPPHRELLVDGEEGKGPIVVPESVEKWTQEIEDLTDDKREARGRECREVVEENFSLQQMHQGYDAVYQKLCKTK